LQEKKIKKIFKKSIAKFLLFYIFLKDRCTNWVRGQTVFAQGLNSNNNNNNIIGGTI